MCKHEFVEYVGLCERWSYCKLCDRKENEIVESGLIEAVNLVQTEGGTPKLSGFTGWLPDNKPEGLNSGLVIRQLDRSEMEKLYPTTEQFTQYINEAVMDMWHNAAVFGQSSLWVSGVDKEAGTVTYSTIPFFGVDRTNYKDWSGYDDYSEPTAEDSRCKLENKIEDLLIKYNVSSEAHNGLFAEIFEAIDEWDAE